MAEGRIAKGTVGGAAQGAAIGSNPSLASATGGLSVPIGAGVGGIFGGIKSNSAENKRKAAESATPGLEDPTQSARLLEIDRISKNIQAGTDIATQTAVNQSDRTTSATQSRLARITGGNTGLTTDALLKAQIAGGQASNNAIAQNQGRLPFFMNLGQQIKDRAESRSLELGLLDRGQNLAEFAQSTKEGNVNRNAFLGSGAGEQGLSSAIGRIQALINSNNVNQESPGIINPNDNLSQINIDPSNQNSSIDLNSISGDAAGAGTAVQGIDLTAASSSLL